MRSLDRCRRRMVKGTSVEPRALRSHRALTRSEWNTNPDPLPRLRGRRPLASPVSPPALASLLPAAAGGSSRTYCPLAARARRARRASPLRENESRKAARSGRDEQAHIPRRPPLLSLLPGAATCVCAVRAGGKGVWMGKFGCWDGWSGPCLLLLSGARASPSKRRRRTGKDQISGSCPGPAPR